MRAEGYPKNAGKQHPGRFGAQVWGVGLLDGVVAA
jgi:hypothetical protein